MCTKPKPKIRIIDSTETGIRDELKEKIIQATRAGILAGLLTREIREDLEDLTGEDIDISYSSDERDWWDFCWPALQLDTWEITKDRSEMFVMIGDFPNEDD